MPAVITGEGLGTQYARELAAHSASLLLIPTRLDTAPRLMWPFKMIYQNREMTTLGCVLGAPDALEPWPIFSAYTAEGRCRRLHRERGSDGSLRVRHYESSTLVAESLSAMLRPSRAQKLLDAEKTAMKKAALLVANLTLARVKM